MSNEPNGKTRLILPVSYAIERAQRDKEEWLRKKREDLVEEKELVTEQAKRIAAKMDQTVYVVQCFATMKGPDILVSRKPNYAILLDHNPYFRCDAILPDGTLGETWEYT